MWCHFQKIKRGEKDKRKMLFFAFYLLVILRIFLWVRLLIVLLFSFVDSHTDFVVCVFFICSDVDVGFSRFCLLLYFVYQILFRFVLRILLWNLLRIHNLIVLLFLLFFHVLIDCGFSRGFCCTSFLFHHLVHLLVSIDFFFIFLFISLLQRIRSSPCSSLYCNPLLLHVVVFLLPLRVHLVVATNFLFISLFNSLLQPIPYSFLAHPVFIKNYTTGDPHLFFLYCNL